MRQILPFLMLMVTVPAMAQPDTISLEDVTITVTPFAERLSETTGSLSILQIDPSLAGSVPHLSDPLNSIPGVFLASGTETTNRLTIRGVGSRTPYSSNRIKAYFEEIPLTNGDGVSTVEDLDLTGISRIEVLKGPGSAMYGSGLGGVVKMKARYPVESGFSGDLLTGYGMFNTWRNALHTGWKKENTSVSFGYGRKTSDGFRQNDRFRRDHLYLHGRTGAGKNRVSFHLFGTDLNAGIPSSLNASDYTNDPTLAAANWLAVGGYEDYTRITGGMTWEHRFNDRWENSLSTFASWLDPYESRPFNILDDRSLTGGFREVVRFASRRWQARTGIELFRESYQWKIFETLSGEEGDLQLQNSEVRQYGNLFAHVRWNAADRMFIETGFNLNLLEYRVETIFNAEGTDQSGKYRYQPVFSPRLGLNYEVVSDQFLHLSAGHGFSAPSLEETLLPEGTINPDLRPETGWNLDAGFRGWLSSASIYYDLSVYSIFLKNMLVTKRVSEEIFSGINAGAARLSGLEAYGRYSCGKGMSDGRFSSTLHASFFLNSNRFTEFIDGDQDHSGNILPGIPMITGHLRLESVYMEKLGIMVEYSAAGRQLMNDANSEIYNGHMVGNVRFSYRIDVQPVILTLFASMQNIANTKYASMILINAPSFGGSAPRYYYPGMPRYISAGIKLTL
jgi:iron complex outermembrane receptor protein